MKVSVSVANFSWRDGPLARRLSDVARIACNVFDIPDGGATARRKLGVLEELCAEVGRPYDAVEKTISTRLEPGESAASFVRRCGAFTELGIHHVAVVTRGPWTDASVATLATAAAALAD